MFRHGNLHAAGELDPTDGRRYAVTVYPHQSTGALVIAGKLRLAATDKAASTITSSDYHTCQRISFGDWRDIWDYFNAPPFAPLVEEIRQRVEGFGAQTRR